MRRILLTATILAAPALAYGKQIDGVYVDLGLGANWLSSERLDTPAYNLALSRRPAEAVANELVRLGIVRNNITIIASGDTHPLVPTAAGVREPQNRRVEIVLR